MWIGFFFSFFFFLAGENLKKPMLFLHQYICSFKMLMYNSFSRNLIGCLVGDLPVTADFSSWVLILSSEDLIISGMRCSFSNSQSTFERKAFFWQTLPLLRIQQPLLLWLEWTSITSISECTTRRSVNFIYVALIHQLY